MKEPLEVYNPGGFVAAVFKVPKTLKVKVLVPVPVGKSQSIKAAVPGVVPVQVLGS